MTASDQDIAAAADRLIAAESSGLPCAPVRDLIGPDDVHAAYAVQERILQRRVAAGGEVVGRKIGLTSPAVQRQLGVDRPDFGMLLADMAVDDGSTVPLGRLLQPRIEAEIAFVLREDLSDGALDLPQVRGAVDYAVAAFEIVDSRIADWDITFGDTVADNGSSGLFVLGEQRRTLDEFEPVAAEMTMSLDSTEVSTGTGAACLGDPLFALQWLAGAARDLGTPLRAGQVVLSGALGPMAPVTGPGTWTTSITGLGSVTVHFSD
ncbi:2-keto-4-pentenoate hydratase [Tsukamurella sputi]|uniref:2-keto-4-pentenoate hydratase n=1 Tax=Tsukamurella sputi TaxID=2591848 RepID=A0A5C5RTN6_9ACTN|nr:fumarylacetoacetate hydrolase family protein [Tsukamurella sputi]TWS26439.1 2-keto-4-pentenoate hydratase [Tsukamurella sputi]